MLSLGLVLTLILPSLDIVLILVGGLLTATRALGHKCWNVRSVLWIMDNHHILFVTRNPAGNDLSMAWNTQCSHRVIWRGRERVTGDFVGIHSQPEGNIQCLEHCLWQSSGNHRPVVFTFVTSVLHLHLNTKICLKVDSKCTEFERWGWSSSHWSEASKCSDCIMFVVCESVRACVFLDLTFSQMFREIFVTGEDLSCQVCGLSN